MKPFRGLVLGDPATKVADVLGRPSRTKSLKEPPVTVNYCDNANYTIEINSNNVMGTLTNRRDSAIS